MASIPAFATKNATSELCHFSFDILIFFSNKIQQFKTGNISIGKNIIFKTREVHSTYMQRFDGFMPLFNQVL